MFNEHSDCPVQVCASLMANIGTINTGMAFGFPAVAIPQLQEENNGFITIDKYQSSWIGKSIRPI